MRRTLMVICSALGLFAASAFAGECKISIERTACPGKTDEMLKPYKGVNPTEERKKLDSVDLCAKFAEKQSKIVRKGVLMSKSVKGTFDGAPINAGNAYVDKVECK